MLKKVFNVKFLPLLFILFVCTGFCSASPLFEFTIDYSCLTDYTSSIKFSGNSLFGRVYDETVEKKIKSPAGLGGSASVFLGSPFNSLEMGIGTSVSYNTFSKCSLDGNDEKVNSGYVISFAAGPAARFTFGKYTSLYFCPGVRFNIQNIKIKTGDKTGVSGNMSYQEKNIMFNVSAGLREWLFTTGKTHIGFDAGFDFAIPVNSFSKMEYSDNSGFDVKDSYKVSSGRFLKFYIGMCLNFGNRTTK